jgi:hypothetical protein
MSDIKILKSLGLKWASVEVNKKEVFFEYKSAKTVIPYNLWDSEIPMLGTAKVYLFQRAEATSQEGLGSWLNQDDHNNYDMGIEFIHKPSEYGSALRAEFNQFDQFTMVLTKNRSKEFWILATYDDIENNGFIVHCAISAENLNIEEAFPYLMALFHLDYYNCLTAANGGDEDFDEAINNCEIIKGISQEAQEKARDYVTELYKSIKDDEEFWRKFS